MIYGWLTLPLLSGYFIASYTPHLQYLHKYLDRQRLIFHSAALGGLLMFCSFVLLELINGPNHVSWPDHKVGPLPELNVVSIFATVLGIFCFIFLHLISIKSVQKQEYLFKAIDRVGTPLDQFLAEAYREQLELLITLDSGKVYVAYMLSTPEPKETLYVNLMPLLSGYRGIDHRVMFTTHYSHLIDGGKAEPTNNVELIIELSDISSFSRFDIDKYNKEYAASKSDDMSNFWSDVEFEDL